MALVHAGIGAGGVATGIHPLAAEIAFLSHALGGFEFDDAVRTHVCAALAAGAKALVLIQHHDAIRPLIPAMREADTEAWRGAAISAYSRHISQYSANEALSMSGDGGFSGGSRSWEWP